MPIVTTVLAVDHLYAAVADDLSSRYCPVARSLFVGRLGLLLAALACVALLFFAFAQFRSRSAQRKTLAYIAACAIALFAIGYGTLVIAGLSGCGGASEAGLTWDWPW